MPPGLISQATLDHVGLLSLACVVFRLAERRVGTPAAAAASVALGAGLALVRSVVPDLQYMPYLLIVPANLAVAWLFASGLRPGREPILLRLIRRDGGLVRPTIRGFRRFITRQCALWAGLSLATAGLAFTAHFHGRGAPMAAPAAGLAVRRTGDLVRSVAPLRIDPLRPARELVDDGQGHDPARDVVTAAAPHDRGRMSGAS